MVVKSFILTDWCCTKSVQGCMKQKELSPLSNQKEIFTLEIGLLEARWAEKNLAPAVMHSTFVSKWLGSSITRSWAVAVAADTRDPKFKSQHRQNLTVNFIIKKRQKERKRDRDWPILKKYHQKLRFFKRWVFLPLTLCICLFIQFCKVIFANGGVRTMDLRWRKPPLQQLCHNQAGIYSSSFISEMKNKLHSLGEFLKSVPERGLAAASKYKDPSIRITNYRWIFATHKR